MEETTICKLCLEPISNHICINCLETSVQKWLKNVREEFLNDFEKFSKNLKEQFESLMEKEKCIKCKEKIEAPVCPFCYLSEIFDFFFLKDTSLAERFIKTFNLDFIKTAYFPENNFVRMPVIIFDKDKNTDINICENCGNQTEDLREVNGSYVCELCEDENRN